MRRFVSRSHCKLLGTRSSVTWGLVISYLGPLLFSSCLSILVDWSTRDDRKGTSKEESLCLWKTDLWSSKISRFWNNIKVIISLCLLSPENSWETFSSCSIFFRFHVWFIICTHNNNGSYFLHLRTWTIICVHWNKGYIM